MSKKPAAKKEGQSKGPSAPAKDDQGYSNFSVPEDTTNLILVVENKKLYVHRDMMMVECPGLREKLNALQEQDESTGNENSTNTPPQTPRGGDPQRPQELALEGMEYENVKEMLKCLYPPRKPVTDENVDLLTWLVGEWDIDRLRGDCEGVLMKREPATLALLLQAQQAKLDDVCEFVAKKLVEDNSIGDLKKQEEQFEQLDFSNQSRLYRHRILFLEDEQVKLDDTATLLYPLTNFIATHHKCVSVDHERFGYLVITKTDENGKKKRQTFNDSGRLEYSEINPKCKDCILQYGQKSRGTLADLEKEGAFEYLKKKFETSKAKAKPAKK